MHSDLVRKLRTSRVPWNFILQDFISRQVHCSKGNKLPRSKLNMVQEFLKTGHQHVPMKKKAIEMPQTSYCDGDRAPAILFLQQLTAFSFGILGGPSFLGGMWDYEHSCGPQLCWNFTVLDKALQTMIYQTFKHNKGPGKEQIYPLWEKCPGSNLTENNACTAFFHRLWVLHSKLGNPLLFVQQYDFYSLSSWETLLMMTL